LPPERLRLVSDHLAALNPRRAAAAAGVSRSLAYDLNRRLGGVYRPADTTYREPYLSREAWYELARMRDCGLPVRAVAARMDRDPGHRQRTQRQATQAP